MEKSIHWFVKARQLCDELGPEDGIDPRVLARSTQVKPKHHKSQQLCKEAKRTLMLVLAGELSDPLLQNLEVLTVSASPDGQFLQVAVCLTANDADQEQQVIARLNAIQGFLRSAIARSVRRKRVPALKFQWVREADEGTGYAHKNDH